jgi:cardiolipin synthase
MARSLNAANLLTLLRLVLVPFVILAILDGRHIQALAWFAAAAFTDLLDGAVARRFGLATPVGAWLDPVADKCLLSGVFLALAAARTVPWWLVGIIFGRDFYILAGAATVMWLTPVRKFPPSIWGKASTFVQIGTAAAWMSGYAGAARPMLWPCAAVTIWSGIHYTWRTLQVWRRRSLPPAGLSGPESAGGQGLPSGPGATQH